MPRASEGAAVTLPEIIATIVGVLLLLWLLVVMFLWGIVVFSRNEDQDDKHR